MLSPCLKGGLAPEGLPRWLSGKETTCQCRRRGFSLCVGKIPWRRKWQHTPVILAWRIAWTEEPGRLYSPWGGKDPDIADPTPTVPESRCFFLLPLSPLLFSLEVHSPLPPLSPTPIQSLLPRHWCPRHPSFMSPPPRSGPCPGHIHWMEAPGP